jgi:hypothetical protein
MVKDEPNTDGGGQSDSPSKQKNPKTATPETSSNSSETLTIEKTGTASPELVAPETRRSERRTRHRSHPPNNNNRRVASRWRPWRASSYRPVYGSRDRSEYTHQRDRSRLPSPRQESSRNRQSQVQDGYFRVQDFPRHDIRERQAYNPSISLLTCSGQRDYPEYDDHQNLGDTLDPYPSRSGRYSGHYLPCRSVGTPRHATTGYPRTYSAYPSSHDYYPEEHLTFNRSILPQRYNTRPYPQTYLPPQYHIRFESYPPPHLPPTEHRETRGRPSVQSDLDSEDDDNQDVPYYENRGDRNWREDRDRNDRRSSR